LSRQPLFNFAVYMVNERQLSVRGDVRSRASEIRTTKRLLTAYSVEKLVAEAAVIAALFSIRVA
jgi:hypothetical protein